ncbi:GNAT family N-acetyltransferase [Brachybacterium sp. P6-10-X1]|uniref:GNAT family N-acetyltransferase n=1 Tax=Brachybacterium sp. P6-10-X1 TaxID=1903186 RepID=UPI000971A14E|nr:GNAT family N-acetyltransferase [Brachybacterium sp. P6-10-X1]APX31415.1 GNAT family N-acetyltransferase [Brachybacterium sp. P6-10-X1]
MSEPVTHPDEVLRRGPVAEIDPRTLYLIAKLRQDVFALEQGATDPDLDGRDLEPGTTLVWIEVPGPVAEAAGLRREPAAHTRVLHEADGGLRIGRVAVRAAERRRGLGGRVMRASIDLARELDQQAEIHVDAQAYLERWYQGLGFETVGEPFDEAGIEHVPMLLRPGRG